jgi:NAD-dependent histone deacetylase SIR2
MKPHYRDGTVPRCDGCGGLVKPGITFFGEPLPGAFHDNLGYVKTADLTIVMGSSLTVYPFSTLPELCMDASVRLLINNERAGGIGSRRDDVIMLGSCDRGVRRLAEELGWLDELESLWKGFGGGKPKPEEGLTIDEQIGKLTEEVERGLNVASDFKSRVEAQINAEEAERAERAEKADDAQTQENREEKDGSLQP